MADQNTAETKEITLAKALKIKNRLASRLASVQEDIRTNNSTTVELSKNVDVRNLAILRDNLSSSLVYLKAVITLKNAPIQDKIFLLAENKATIAWLKTIPTTDGKQYHAYHATEIEYVATFNKNQITEMIRMIESRIDSIQDELDEFNHSTKLTIPVQVLNLAN